MLLNKCVSDHLHGASTAKKDETILRLIKNNLRVLYARALACAENSQPSLFVCECVSCMCVRVCGAAYVSACVGASVLARVCSVQCQESVEPCCWRRQRRLRRRLATAVRYSNKLQTHTNKRRRRLDFPTQLTAQHCTQPSRQTRTHTLAPLSIDTRKHASRTRLRVYACVNNTRISIVSIQIAKACVRVHICSLCVNMSWLGTCTHKCRAKCTTLNTQSVHALTAIVCA